MRKKLSELAAIGRDGLRRSIEEPVDLMAALGSIEGQGAIVLWGDERFCLVEGCEFMACRWAGTGKCHPHSVEEIGEAEMRARYEITHGCSWDEVEP